MFAEVKDMLPVDGDDYDAQIITLIKAAVLDLTTSAEIVLPGSVSISRTWVPPVTEDNTVTPGYWSVEDHSTLKDPFVITVIATWCNMHIGNPPNLDYLQKSYREKKGQMRLSRKYTRYGGDGGCGC